MKAEGKARRKAAATALSAMRRVPVVDAPKKIDDGTSARALRELVREVERLALKADYPLRRHGSIR